MLRVDNEYLLAGLHTYSTIIKIPLSVKNFKEQKSNSLRKELRSFKTTSLRQER